MGMRALSPQEEKLLKASTAKVRRDRFWKGSVFLVVPVVLLAVAALSYIQQDARLKRIRALADAGLIHLVARFKPVLTYKTGGSCGGEA